jgi:hypothetical protein
MKITLKKADAPVSWKRLTKGKKIRNTHEWKEVKE